MNEKDQERLRHSLSRIEGKGPKETARRVMDEHWALFCELAEEYEDPLPFEEAADLESEWALIAKTSKTLCDSIAELSHRACGDIGHMGKEHLLLLAHEIERTASKKREEWEEQKKTFNGYNMANFEPKVGLVIPLLAGPMNCQKAHTLWIAAAVEAWKRRVDDDEPLHPEAFKRAADFLNKMIKKRQALRGTAPRSN